MQTQQNAPSLPARPLRLWPGVVLVLVQWFMWIVLPSIAPEALLVGTIGGLLAAPLIILWWVGFSRAPWLDRLGAIVVMGIGVAAAQPFLHQSLATALGGTVFYFFVVPALCLALVAAAVITRHRSTGVRRMGLAAAILLACGFWTLVRTDAITVGRLPLAWRWTASAEERLLAQGEMIVPVVTPAVVEPAAPPAAVPVTAVTASPEVMREPAIARAEWPGFRGSRRDGIVPDTNIATDWSATPPVELWRRPVGPGWSSFAVSGDRFYTQEQRGDDELVACYRMSDGTPLWVHRDPARFWEGTAGAGPRATPSISNGRVYTLGATGILNALVADTGALVWSRNVKADTAAPTPDWGFATSPLVIDDAVIVAAAGTLAAYDARTGAPRWTGPQHSGNYSSPHLVTIDGVAQVLQLSGPNVTSFLPADGTVLWDYTWEGGAIAQPAMTPDGDVLVTAVTGPGGLGTRRLDVSRAAAGWTATERWTSNGLKPYFNDFVVHGTHAYGFDNNILAAIDLQDGKRAWKGGRYGNGQLILLSAQDLLLVLSEDGELALVSATPDKFTELAKFPAIEGMTWNHPVLVGDVLLVRNGAEMAAFRLPRR
jgi:outer membrane protein assembly factor BamB